MVFKAVHLWNILLPILLMSVGSVTASREVQRAKAASPITFTDSGMTMDWSLSQLENASLLIDVTVEGIDMDLRLEQ